ncbi:AI-2E family transporter [Desulfolithobacter dissulfuricans]|uniref:AI-2E family transporter n=1 Tax=Desulfolithobacter dissulfuricans TaxID=2795293 RepID=A0A915U305_9BACT|nr:AI-2E family transporter [Desulfolithobacter dissulfuricans]BCO10413.1 AI-2E family transporter [Desulfolithobacter dissulfuricans]
MKQSELEKSAAVRRERTATGAGSGRPGPVQTRYFFFIFLAALCLLGLVLSPFWQLLVLAFLLSGIFRPIYLWLTRWVSPWMASLLTCGLIVLIVFVPLTFCIGALSSEALSLYHLGKDSNVLLKLQQFIQNNTLLAQAQVVLADMGINVEPTDVIGLVSDLSKTVGLFIYGKASNWAANIMNFVLQFCILILVIFFLLIELERLINFIKHLSPLPDTQDDLLMKKFLEISGVILVGNGLSGVFQGIMGGAFFVLLGFKSPVLWGGVMAILAFLPIFGIGLVLLPTAAILLINGYFEKAMFTLVFYVVLSFSVEYLIKPKFVGSHVKMHTLLVFLAIIGGMNMFGVLGIIYGPLIVTGFLTLSDIYLKEYRPALEHPDS